MLNNLDGARYLAWCDLETSGSDEETDHILEVAVVVTDLDLMTIESYTSVIRPSADMNQIVARADPIVQRMHARNGLWDALADCYTPVAWADIAISSMLGRVAEKGQFALAGSGVAHFDRRFIDIHLPLFSRYLKYWVLDVGVVRRVMKLTGRDDLIVPQQNKEHRAHQDVLVHIREMRLIKEGLRK